MNIQSSIVKLNHSGNHSNTHTKSHQNRSRRLGIYKGHIIQTLIYILYIDIIVNRYFYFDQAINFSKTNYTSKNFPRD